MDKETLSNYGWIVICVLVLAVMLALATPFGTFVAGAVKSTTQGLFDVNQSALNSTGLINIGDQSFGEGNGGNAGNETPVTPVAYQIIEGAGQTVTTTDALFRSNADYNKFNSVKVDNNVVDQSNYTVSEGSTVVTFNGEYLATLSNGTHTLEVVSNDGSASCEFTVNVEKQNNKIPEGGKYTAADGTVYNPGDEMPEITLIGDKYRYGDYEYRYNCYCPTGNLDYWSNNESQQGWGVMVINRKQTSYGPILESINGYPITNMYGTFHYCDKMTVAPKIPQTVINMNHTFAKCESLISASAIPNSVIEMVQTFEYCYALKNAPDMSNAINVTNMSNTFKQCTSMETVPNLSNSTKLTSLQSTFVYCKSLTDLSGLLLPDSITEMTNTFEGCNAVTIAPKIPSSVKTMNYTFHTCKSLLQAPEIPNKVYSMTNTFYGCTSLTGEISLPCSLARKNYTYNNCPAIITYYHIGSCNGSCGK